VSSVRPDRLSAVAEFQRFLEHAVIAEGTGQRAS
jgi:hypothetical protein